VKHDLKGVLKYRGKILDPPLPTDVTDILATTRHIRDRHNEGTITDRDRHSIKTKVYCIAGN